MHWIRRSVRRLASLPVHTRLEQWVLIALAALAAAVYTGSANADWVWSTGYLWNTSAPFSVTVTSHADANWTQMVAQSAADWSRSRVVSVNVGSSGKIDLYDGYYGNSEPCAWTQYWQHGGHIAHDAVYLNESCLAGWSDYWKQYALCQELGHALGLPDHNTTPTTPSCTAPTMPATTPGTDDFAELALLYGTAATKTKGGGKGSTALAGGASTEATTDTPGNGGSRTDHRSASHQTMPNQ
jgi:hypothetical protein